MGAESHLCTKTDFQWYKKLRFVSSSGPSSFGSIHFQIPQSTELEKAARDKAREIKNKHLTI